LCVSIHFFNTDTQETRFEEELQERGFSKRKFCNSCARFGYFDLAKWGHSHNCILAGVISGALVSHSSETLTLPFMKWARSNGARIHSSDYENAAKEYSLETVKWLAGEGGSREKGDRWKCKIAAAAAKRGQMDILRWAKRNPLHRNYNLPLLEAATTGGLEVLKWLISEDSSFEGFGEDPDNVRFCLEVATHRNSIRILKWLHETFGIIHSPRLCRDAAYHGNLEMLKYLRDCGEEWNEETCIALAENGHFEGLKWVREQGCPWDEYTLFHAAYGANFEVLKWAWEQGGYWDESTCSQVAKSGNLDMLKWVREHECPWDFRTCSSAADCGNLEMLRWAWEEGCPWNEDTCSLAAQNGNLEILKWARDHGCPWDEITCYKAAEHNHVEILNWAIVNGCPCKPVQIFKAAAENGKLDVLNWAKKNLSLRSESRNFLATHNVNITHSCVITWMQKNGMLSAEDFPAVSENSNSMALMVWMVKENSPTMYKGQWREIEEILEKEGTGIRRSVIAAAQRVLGGLWTCEDFFGMVLNFWGGV
jgi:hypothetical protein